ncbi:MAG: hypothetical protein A3D16_12315 [Rhodobacterales bacterium RIFCSPHIGHO2_02_FULL_62_130]|nr:MAG: hypothetical protein A3D16_12315 [Rhodobacterales bacterium RIFCSPHIGHO2_02_FULL_62_130]OHC53883.1 MAG: hypothetical protein A3E48_23335 [Rhodobacterales bacterium RIFCSPHIGHO2_12_FULL_62_75]HCZ00142.1 hypothetical protein [Rhodobacter sp.]
MRVPMHENLIATIKARKIIWARYTALLHQIIHAAARLLFVAIARWRKPLSAPKTANLRLAINDTARRQAARRNAITSRFVAPKI